MEYVSGIMVTATNSSSKRLDFIQHKALRRIADAAKSTHILAKQLQAELDSRRYRLERNAALLYQRILSIRNEVNSGQTLVMQPQTKNTSDIHVHYKITN